jgi:hypothetical protein
MHERLIKDAPAWYDRVEVDYLSATALANWTADEAEKIFAELGLTGDFWKLRRPPTMPATTGMDQKR